MNEYRNFQRKKGRKKETKHNKHAKGKESLQQKNKYYNTNSNRKYRQNQRQQLIAHRVRSTSISRQLELINGKLSKQTVHVREQLDVINRINLCHNANFDESNNSIDDEQIQCPIVLKRHASPCYDHLQLLLWTHSIFHPSADKCLCIINSEKFKSFNIVVISHRDTKAEKVYNHNCNVARSISACYSNDNKRSWNNLANNICNSKINRVDNLPCDILLYSICDSYLCPHEIYRLLNLSKNINKMLISNNGALFEKLKSKQNITKYILHGTDTMNHALNLDDGGNLSYRALRTVDLLSDVQVGYGKTLMLGGDYLLSAFKSISHVYNCKLEFKGEAWCS